MTGELGRPIDLSDFVPSIHKSCRQHLRRRRSPEHLRAPLDPQSTDTPCAEAGRRLHVPGTFQTSYPGKDLPDEQNFDRRDHGRQRCTSGESLRAIRQPGPMLSLKNVPASLRAVFLRLRERARSGKSYNRHSDADTSKSIHGSQLLAFVPTTCEGVQLVHLGFPLGLTSRIGVPRNRHRDRIVGSDHVGGHFKPRAA